jgi:hypothetical protein
MLMVRSSMLIVPLIFAFVLLAGCASQPEGLYGPPASLPPSSQPSIPAATPPAAPVKTTEEQAKDFCGQANVAMVYVCGNYFGVVSSLLGGGTTFYKDGNQVQCPVVGPDAMSEECKLLELGSNCAQIDICNPPAETMPGSDRDEHGCIGSAGYTWCEEKQKCLRIWEEACGEQIVGGDKDAHGCIGSAGYTWCEAKQKCLRVWEEECKVS